MAMARRSRSSSTPATPSAAYDAAPVGVAAVQRAAHELVLGHAARGPAGLVVGAGAGDLVAADRGGRPRRRAPWPARAPGRRRSAPRRRPRPRRSPTVTPEAPPASATRLSRGRLAAVDGDAVEARVGGVGAAARAAARRGTAASVVTTAIIVAEVGADHRRRPWPSPPRRTSPPSSSTVRVATFGRGVGRADRLGRGRAAVRRERAGGRRDAGLDAVHRQRHADHARRADEHLVRRERRRGSPASAAMRRASARPCAPVAALALPLEITIAARASAVAAEALAAARAPGAPAARLRVKTPAARGRARRRRRARRRAARRP